MSSARTLTPSSKDVEVAAGVLIVDDDENLVANLAAFLETHRFTVERAHDVEGAMWAVTTRPVRLALVDYRLGRQTGADVMVAIRKHFPDFPIILMSAFVDEWLRALLQAHRPSSYLKKPFSSTEVLGAINEALVQPRRQSLEPQPEARR